MDAQEMAKLAMEAGEMAGREDVPEDVRGLLTKLVAALAGGDAEPDGDEVLAEAEPPAKDEAAPEAKAKEGEPDGEDDEEKYRALGRVAAEVIGEKDLVKARGKLRGMLESAKTADTATANADAIRRDRAWEKAIQSGRARAGQVWVAVQLKGGKRGKAPADFRKRLDAKFPDVRELEGYLETLPRLAAGNDEPDAATLDAADDARAKPIARASLSEAQVRRARALGVDPEVLAAQVAVASRGMTAAEEN